MINILRESSDSLSFGGGMSMENFFFHLAGFGGLVRSFTSDCRGMVPMKMSCFMDTLIVGCFKFTNSFIQNKNTFKPHLLTLKAPPTIYNRRQFQILSLFQK